MARFALAVAVALVAFAAVASGCATPHGGCRWSVCEKYRNVNSAGIWFPGSNYSDPNTWKKGWLPYIGYLVGIYNKNVNGGVYNKAGIPNTPGLNYERFDLETNLVDSNTGLPYAQASTETNLADCCITCAKTDGCYLYQFYEPKDANGGPQCYLLSGGSVKTDFPERGTPFAGTKTQQTKGVRKTVPLSYVGGRCNGTTGVSDDPHFVGAKGVRFDFNGDLEKSFCLMTDKRIQINALLRGYKDEKSNEGATVGSDGKALRTWIRELAFLWKDSSDHVHTLHLVARSGTQQERGDGFLEKALVDGKKLEVPQAAGEEVKKGYMSFKFISTVKKGAGEEDKFRVRIGNYLDATLTMRVAHKKMQSPLDAEAHFNLLVNKVKTTEAVHGVLGQTYRNTPQQVAKAVKFSQVNKLLGGPIQADGKSGAGFLEGQVGDYVTSSVTAPDCQFSAFSEGSHVLA